ILAGERTGHLVEGLRAAAELQEEELRMTQVRARARVELIATVGTALLVLSLAAMIFIPYLDIFHLSYSDEGFLPP
ncbi:MAG: type II secretion system F family protein, partial [Candidatus Eremiobacteraeota bacterium]|nr:type II secretion system F family protein [Candidatus Eremiobacteraeota bacterium]